MWNGKKQTKKPKTTNSFLKYSRMRDTWNATLPLGPVDGVREHWWQWSVDASVCFHLSIKININANRHVGTVQVQYCSLPVRAGNVMCEKWFDFSLFFFFLFKSRTVSVCRPHHHLFSVRWTARRCRAGLTTSQVRCQCVDWFEAAYGRN